MERSPLAHLNPTDPAELARDTAHELVRAAVAIANLCDERPDKQRAMTAEMLVDELADTLAQKLEPMMRVFDTDDLNSMILLLGEAIDHVGFGDGLDMRDVWVFRRWADPDAFDRHAAALGEDLAGARVDLLREGVVVLGDEDHRGERTVTASGPSADRVRDAVAGAVPGAIVDWAGPTPRRLRPVPCAAYRQRGDDLLRLYVPLEADDHVDDIFLAEDEETVVVYVLACMSSSFATGLRRHQPYRLWLEQPLGDRVVIDGVTGQPLQREER